MLQWTIELLLGRKSIGLSRAIHLTCWKIGVQPATGCILCADHSFSSHMFGEHVTICKQAPGGYILNPTKVSRLFGLPLG
ncbi:hypothetical protein CY35_02G059200 [Sphagnum magellanicum]|nr:hypothetical protein CY35_02G059200 [Sphagnum magellanicum]